MFIVTFKPNKKYIDVVVEKDSVVDFVNILERSKVHFKVSNGASFISQEFFGLGNFDYWLKPTDNFV